MTDVSTYSQRAGEIQAGMVEETTRIEVYCHRENKAEWQEEAEKNGYRSASKYLHDLIQEARSLREGGLPFIATEDQRVSKLESKIQRLQAELEEAREEHGSKRWLSINDLVDQSLTSQCQSLDELLEGVKASTSVSDHLRRQIEEQLYSLAEDGEVEFQRGAGWRRMEGE